MSARSNYFSWFFSFSRRSYLGFSERRSILAAFLRREPCQLVARSHLIWRRDRQSEGLFCSGRRTEIPPQNFITFVREPVAAFARAWRGELSLYRAAYGLGGVGGALGAAFGDCLLDLSMRGSYINSLVFAAAALGELGFAWICVVGTWRARRKGRHGAISIGLALAFVWAQLLFTAGWVVCSGLADIGLTSPPMEILAEDVLKPEMQALLSPGEAVWAASLLGHLTTDSKEKPRPSEKRARQASGQVRAVQRYM